MRRILSIIGLATFLAGPAFAQVQLDQWGSYAVMASSDCADFCDPDTDLSWLLGLTIEPATGGAEIDMTNASQTGPRGDAFSEASVQVPLAPVVRVDATSAAGGWVDGTAVAVQGFTYVGLVADTIDVNVQLTGTIGNPDADPTTGLAAQVSYVGNANVASFVFENAAIGLITPDGAVQLETTSHGPVDQVDVLSIPVSPGDQFYLVASSAATAGGAGAFAESLGTLTITFDPADAQNLEAASEPPSLPTLDWAGIALLALALVAATQLCSFNRAVPLRATPPSKPSSSSWHRT